MALTPGVRFLLANTPRILAGPLLAYVALRICSDRMNVDFGTTVTTLLVLCSMPVLFALQLIYNDGKNYLAARKLGARLPPQTGDWTPGSLIVAKRLIEKSKDGYIGTSITKYEYNTSILKLFFTDRIMTREPEQMKIVLATEFDSYEKGKEVRAILQPLIGDGVFATDGDLWKFHRTMSRPFFTRDRISDFDNFDRHATMTMARLRERLSQGYSVDIQDMAARFTLDSATEFLFGHDVCSLSALAPYPHNAPAHLRETGGTHDSSQRFANALANAQLILLQRARFMGIWPLLEIKRNKLKPYLDEVYSLIEPIVNQAIEDKRKRAQVAEENKTEGQTLLRDLVNSTEDPIMLRDEIMSLLLAGRDTTASLISFVIYMLADNPSVMQRLRAEVLSRVGPSRRPSYEDIRDMKYLRAVLNETLRLYPPVPFNMRMSKAEGTLWPSSDSESLPYYIPPRTRISLNLLGMHRRKDLWGPDALEFDPDRFLDERLHKYLTPRPFIFLPFNAGPRICLGQQFAYNEASFFLVRLLQSFSDISLDLTAQPPKTLAPSAWAGSEGRKGKEKLRPKAHLTMYIDGGLWVNMEEARRADESA